MPVTYEPWLVLLSIVMAIQGAYVGLAWRCRLAMPMACGTACCWRPRRSRWPSRFGRCISSACLPSYCRSRWTISSFRRCCLSSCVIVVGARGLCRSSGSLTMLRPDAVFLPDRRGIFSMHYLGMAAFDASADMAHAPAYVAASMAVAIAASGSALWLATGRGGRPTSVPVGDCLRYRRFRHALHCHQGVTLFRSIAAPSAPALSKTSWRSSSPSSAFACRACSCCWCRTTTVWRRRQPMPRRKGRLRCMQADPAIAPAPVPP